MRELAKQLNHYLPLIGILLASLWGFSLFSTDKTFKLALSLAVAASYVCWGIVHHYLHKDLHIEVVIEYLAVAFFGLVVIFSVVLRS